MSDDDFPKLLLAAFETAKRTRKDGWRVMTVAVLKNRLLQLTEHRFNEAQYNATSMSELVARHSDLVRVDRNARPITVEWLEHSSADPHSEAADTSNQRLRADLWRAVLDYSSGQEYEWDVVAGQARPLDRADPGRKLPTIDRAQLMQWRTEFVGERQGKVSEADLARLEDWAEKGLGSQRLPRDSLGAWNAFLKSKLVQLLNAWFVERGFSTPRILAPIKSEPTDPPQSDLRALVHECVDALSVEELHALMLPAHVLLRVARR
jgi:hypothetical protein